MQNSENWDGEVGRRQGKETSQWTKEERKKERKKGRKEGRKEGGMKTYLENPSLISSRSPREFCLGSHS